IGYFIVEGEAAGLEFTEPSLDYARETLTTEAIASSLPHRDPDEQAEIVACFTGVTTWQRVCREFDLDWNALPEQIRTVDRRPRRGARAKGAS
ncbi:MAG: hypothetical protein P8020_21910, partial [Acidobacteriota bacterium]